MRSKKIILGLILFLLGMIGVSSMLTMDIPLPAEAEAILKAQVGEEWIKYILLVNPTIMVIVAVIVGTVLYQKVNLRVPVIEKMVGITDKLNLLNIIKYGVLGGLLAGALLSIVGLIFTPILPLEFKELGESLQPTLAARFLYGGLTEEILMRFGLMTLFVWIFSEILNGLKSSVYWSGIIFAAVIFAFGHFPIAYQAVSEPSLGLLSYILIGNTIGGIIFGWLYWKKGLESAFIAHIFAHVIMVSLEPFLS